MIDHTIEKSIEILVKLGFHPTAITQILHIDRRPILRRHKPPFGNRGAKECPVKFEKRLKLPDLRFAKRRTFDNFCQLYNEAGPTGTKKWYEFRMGDPTRLEWEEWCEKWIGWKHRRKLHALRLVAWAREVADQHRQKASEWDKLLGVSEG